ncbi:MAG: nuclear transport factor 2 family protein [Chloroflexota bacterium]
MATEDDVRNASRRFYTALNRMANGDATPLAEIWSHDAGVTTMHPIGGRETGWDQVRGVWEQVAHLASDGRIELNDQAIQASGDMAYELGTERGEFTLAGQQVKIEQRVTNIYRKEAGGWKIVHHHTDLSPEMLDLLKRLQTQG